MIRRRILHGGKAIRDALGLGPKEFRTLREDLGAAIRRKPNGRLCAYEDELVEAFDRILEAAAAPRNERAA
jgi:hypothetical protein